MLAGADWQDANMLEQNRCKHMVVIPISGISCHKIIRQLSVLKIHSSSSHYSVRFVVHCPGAENLSSLVFLEIVETFEIDKRLGL